jgi:hypothetical protein
MTLRSTLSAPMASGINVEGAQVFQLGRPASQRAADRTLVSFSDEAALKAYLVGGYANIYNPGAVGFSASPPPAACDVLDDEPAGERGRRSRPGEVGRAIHLHLRARHRRCPHSVIRIAQVGADGTSLSMRGTYPLASGATTPVGNAGLYLNGATLVTVTTNVPSYAFSPAWFASGAYSASVSNIEVMSLATPEAPTTRWRAEFDGTVLTSRRIGDRLYVVSRFVPQLGLIPSAVPVTQLLPEGARERRRGAPLLDASTIYSPPQGERAGVADMIVVTAIDLVQPRIVQSLAVMGLAETVYASPQS